MNKIFITYDKTEYLSSNEGDILSDVAKVNIEKLFTDSEASFKTDENMIPTVELVFASFTIDDTDSIVSHLLNYRVNGDLQQLH